jgi:hypothetical protein
MPRWPDNDGLGERMALRRVLEQGATTRPLPEGTGRPTPTRPPPIGWAMEREERSEQEDDGEGTTI